MCGEPVASPNTARQNKLLMSSHTQDTAPDHGKPVQDANR
jgi:hypothetical protein